MRCPYCRNTDTRVIDSRAADDGGTIRRRRQCPECTRRFTTAEAIALSVGKACQGRPVSEDALAVLAQRVEDIVRGGGSAEVASQEVGLAILGPLRELDEVAYLRFASVYRSFDTLEDFEAEIALLRAEAEPLGEEPAVELSTKP
jgi:transcriptional repressor NrdR